MLGSLHEPFYVEILIWLFPIAFMFHGLEEIITVESFMTNYKNKIPKSILVKLTLSMKNKLGAKSAQHSVSIAWILLYISLTTINTAINFPTGENFLLYTAIFNVFFLQAFSHIGQTIIFRGYTPGVITAIFIVVPYSILTYYLFFEMGLIDGYLLFKSIPLSILMVPVFLIGNLLGRKLIR
ncbi:HXXEE domain-containing protein [Lederbergia citri]|uniref:HXXEE domain-containing protein n=1 Tax=Lederbergia citri TaxID=2833580 RepID=A0A942YHK2_9BACI|nr:HXXEE domain-containing protein [Lederbergia citri]MBS4196667.1 HXXEE domain-containing protein [Lederbergia citri]